MLLFSLGEFGSGRLLHLGVGNSVSGIRHGLAHFKERRLPLTLQHDRLCVGQHGLGSRLFRHSGIFYRGSGSLGGRGCLGNVFLVICHLQTSSYYKVVVIRVPLQGQNATIDKVLWIGLNLLPQDGFGKAPTTALCF